MAIYQIVTNSRYVYLCDGSRQPPAEHPLPGRDFIRVSHNHALDDIIEGQPHGRLGRYLHHIGAVALEECSQTACTRLMREGAEKHPG